MFLGILFCNYEQELSGGNMTEELIKQLLEAGVHFGHQAKRWNPKMKRYIFGERSGIYIIDLEKTVEALNKARDFLVQLASKGQTILFVGTKKQAQDIIKQEAVRCKMFYVNRRWLGGLMTNFQTIKKSIQHLKDIENMEKDGLFNSLSKKEVAQLTKEKERLERNLSGIKEIVNLPGVLFVVDSKQEETAVREARKLSMPIAGLIDTNCDPDLIDFPIPGNDDAMKSIRLITSLIADSIIEGRKQFLQGKGVIELPKEEKIQTKEKIQLEQIEKPEEKEKLAKKKTTTPKTTKKRGRSKIKN